MVAIRILSLALALALGVGVATDVSAGKLIPYQTITEDDPNGHLDTGVTATPGICGHVTAGTTPAGGCYTRFGGLCSADPDAACDLAVVPAGRCTKGTGSCIWPQGAGTCVDDSEIACLPTNPADHGATSGTFASFQCRDADPNTSTDLCDMSTNDPTCECQGTDATAGDYEGTICGNVVQSVCSDGDAARDVGGVATGGGLCVDINLGGASETVAGCGSASTSPGFLANVKFAPENPPELTTPNRRPGTALVTPNEGGPIRNGAGTAVWEIDEYGAGPYAQFGVRATRTKGDSYFADAGFTAGAVSGGFDANILLYYCNAPPNYNVSRPVQGVCTGGTCAGTEPCGRTVDCNGAGTCSPGGGATCDFTPGAATTLYCHEAPLDGFGFMWTRDMTSAEHTLAQSAPSCTGGVCVGGGLDGQSCTTAADCGTSSCPPSCGNAIDLHTGEHVQISSLLANVPAPDGPRASAQLAFDNLEGQRQGKGGFLSVQPLVSVSWVSQGDNSCFVGGNPDVVNSVCTGTCDQHLCDIGLTNQCLSGPNVGNACTSDFDCGVCNAGFVIGNNCAVDADCERCGDGVTECNSAASLDCNEMIGQCDDNTGRGCDPFVGGTNGGCGGSACRVCGGTPATQPVDNNFTGGPSYFDAIDGSNTPPVPIGYNTHGFAELGVVGRVSVLTDVNGTVRIPITAVSTNYAARGELRDDGTAGTFDDDTMAVGSNAPTGIGAGGTYPVGSVFSIDPTGSASTVAASWNAESSTAFVPNTVNDFGPGANGLPGCIGDNDTNLSPCDPAASGADDEDTTADFTLNLTGTAGAGTCTGVGVPHAGCRNAVTAKFKISDPTRMAPVLHNASATTLRDETLFGLAQNLDVMTKARTTWCPIIGQCDISGNDCVTTADCPGGEVCSAREQNCTQKSYCQDNGGDGDADQVCSSIDNCPAAANLDQADAESDGIGDACDPCLTFDNSGPGGLDDANSDGIPDVCQCGDANLNNLVDNNDLSTTFFCIQNAGNASCIAALGTGKADSNNNNLWDNNDLSKLFFALQNGPSTNHTLTCANRPEGTPVP